MRTLNLKNLCLAVAIFCLSISVYALDKMAPMKKDKRFAMEVNYKGAPTP